MKSSVRTNFHFLLGFSQRLMDQNLSFHRRRFFRRAFDCNVHADVADGSLFLADHRVYKFIAM